MAKSSANYFNHAVALLVVCISATALGLALRNREIVIAANSRTPMQRSDAKTIERKDFPNEPFRLGNLSVKGMRVSTGSKFSARLSAETGGGTAEEWIENLTFTLQNTSSRRMTYINLELDFPETAMNGPMMVYNQLGIGIHPKAIADSARHNKELALAPGDTYTFSLSAEQLKRIDEFLAHRNFKLSDLNQTTIRIDHIIFDDGVKWSQGDEYKPNPAAPGGYERVKLSSQ